MPFIIIIMITCQIIMHKALYNIQYYSVLIHAGYIPFSCNVHPTGPSTMQDAQINEEVCLMEAIKNFRFPFPTLGLNRGSQAQQVNFLTTRPPKLPNWNLEI